MNLARPSSRLVLFILASLVLLILYQTHQLAPLEDLAGRLGKALSLPLYQTGTTVRHLAQDVKEWQAYRQKNRELEELADALMVENVRLSEALFEASLLQEELGLGKSNPDLELKPSVVIGQALPAKVVRQDPLNLSHSLWIGQGRTAGILPDMPVVTKRGLVGKVAYAGPDWSRVLLITDARSSINVLIQRSRATGLLQGSPSGVLTMRMIPHDQDVRAGDLVLTSGLGGGFPKGMVVGQVIAVRAKDYEPYKEATIRPTVDFQALEVISVVTSFTPAEFVEEGTLLAPP